MWSFVKDAFGWMTNVKSSETSAGRALDQGLKMLDERKFTPEEQAENRQNLFKLYIEQMKVTGSQSTPTAITRRYLMWGILLLVAELVNVAILLALLGKDWLVIAEIGISFSIGTAFVAGVAFYFGPHLVKAAVGEKT